MGEIEDAESINECHQNCPWVAVAAAAPNVTSISINPYIVLVGQGLLDAFYKFLVTDARSPSSLRGHTVDRAGLAGYYR